MRIETAGAVSIKTGSRFGAIVHAANNKKAYVYDVPTGLTLNHVELLAVKFALLGIKTKASICTSSSYVASMLEREPNPAGLQWADPQEGWAKVPKSNKELIEELRSLVVSKEVEILYGRNEEARDPLQQALLQDVCVPMVDGLLSFLSLDACLCVCPVCQIGS